jgi:DNA mismatch repair protein MutL
MGSSKSFSPAVNNSGFGTKTDATPQQWRQFWNTEDAPIPEIAETAQQQLLDVSDLHPKGPYLLKGSFIVASIQTGLLLVHYRRAQERLLYEELMRGFYVAPLASQQLLFPLEKNASKQEKSAWDEHRITLERIGFSWQWEGEQLQLLGIPDILSESTVLSCVDRILEQLQMGTLDKGEIAHTVMSHLAFAGSMGGKLTHEEAVIEDLLGRLFRQTENQFTPNGKRIVNTITNEELLHLF